GTGDDGGERAVPLRPRPEEGRFGFVIQRLILAILHDSDDLDPVAAVRTLMKAFAKGVFILKEPVRQRLVNNRDVSRSGTVSIIEIASGHEPSLHRAEITGCDVVEIRVRSLVHGRNRFSFRIYHGVG